MTTNIFVILPIPNSHSSLWDIVTDSSEATARKNDLGTEMMVKLYEGDDGSTHGILNGVPKYTHAQMKVILREPEWVSELSMD